MRIRKPALIDRPLENLRTYWITTVMTFRGARIAQLYRMVELMYPGRIPKIMILIGKNNVSRGSDEEEAQWELMMVCLYTTLWQKFKCAVLTVCTVPMTTRTLESAGRRQNEGVIGWNNIVRNLTSRIVGWMILIDIEHNFRAMDQASITTDGNYFDSLEGQAWMNRVFQERLDKLEVDFFHTRVLKKEETTNEPALSTFVPPKPRNTSGSGPSRELQAAELQRARAKNGRTGPIGRRASKKNYSSTAKIRTCQPDYRDNRYIEIEIEIGKEIKNQIGDYEYQPRRTTTRK